MNRGGIIPAEQMEQLNQTFNGFQLDEDSKTKPNKIIFDSEKVRELKAREDYYYE